MTEIIVLVAIVCAAGIWWIEPMLERKDSDRLTTWLVTLAAGILIPGAVLTSLLGADVVPFLTIATCGVVVLGFVKAVRWRMTDD